MNDPAGKPSPSGWRTSRPIAALVICLFAVVQLSIPISRLGSERSQRFGWQMYSSASPSPQFSVTTPDGEIDIDLGDYLASERADVDLITWLPPHLCETVTGAIEVSWESGSYRC